LHKLGVNRNPASLGGRLHMLGDQVALDALRINLLASDALPVHASFDLVPSDTNTIEVSVLEVTHQRKKLLFLLFGLGLQLLHCRLVLFDRLLQLLSPLGEGHPSLDRKSTRLNSSHVKISYAVF